MAHGKFKVLDSDIHIIEPPDLWTRYIDPAFRDRAPIGLTEDEGDLRLAHAGKPWGRVSGVDADRNRRRQGRNYALNQERWRPYAERGWTSKVQLEAMDIEGIDVAVVYPSRGLFALTIPDMEPRLAAAMARAYNDWLYEFCQENPERLLRRHDLPVRRQRRGGGGSALRAGVRLPGHVPATERGERAELARPVLRAALGHARGAGSPAGVPRGIGLAAAAGGRAVRRQHDAQAHLFPPGGADAHRRRLLRGRHSGAPSPAAR